MTGFHGSLRRFVPMFAGVVVASVAFAANVVQYSEYRAKDDSFAVLTAVEGYTPEDHKGVLETYKQRDKLVFVPLDMPVRMFEEDIKPADTIKTAYWKGYTRSDEGLLVAGDVKAPIGSSEIVSTIKTRPGQLFVTGDLLSYYHETIVPGAVIDEMLRSYRGPLMDADAINKEIARREAGEVMKLWRDYKGVEDNPLQYMSSRSLELLKAAAEGDGATWTRTGAIAECLIPMTDDDARRFKRAIEWQLAFARRDHSYEGKVLRGFASIFEETCHITPVLNKGLKFTVDLPGSMQAFSNQAAIQSDTRDGKVMSSSQAFLRFANYKEMRTLLDSDPQAEVNWLVRDRDTLKTMYRKGTLRFSDAASAQ